MKILVTGGSWLVGSYVVEELLRHGHSVKVLDLKQPRHTAEYCRADILQLPAVLEAMRGTEVVVHMAGIPHPLNDPPERVYAINTIGTFNVLESAARLGIPKVVFTSSESTLGFAFAAQRLIPEYLPIDENHPLRPQDPYGLSKVSAEILCRGYSARCGMRTVCLREPWIWVPEAKEIAFYRTLVAEYRNWPKNLWAYVHVADVARAHRLAVEKNLPSLHEAMFISAAENWTGMDSRKLATEFYPEVKDFRGAFDGPASFISSARAKQLLGYRPEHTATELLGS